MLLGSWWENAAKIGARVSGGAIDADKFLGKRRARLEGRMYSLGLSDEIRIEGTNNNTEVIRMTGVQADEMLAIEGHESPASVDGQLQHLLIRKRLACLASFLGGEHVISKPSEFCHYREGNILIRIQVCHC